MNNTNVLNAVIIVLLVAMNYLVFKGYELATYNSDALAILVSLIGLGLFLKEIKMKLKKNLIYK